MFYWPGFHQTYWWVEYHTARLKNTDFLCSLSSDLQPSPENMYIYLVVQALLNDTNRDRALPPHMQTPSAWQDCWCLTCLEGEMSRDKERDPPVCLRLYHGSLTAVRLFKQRQMASGKVRKSPSPSPLLRVTGYKSSSGKVLVRQTEECPRHDPWGKTLFQRSPRLWTPVQIRNVPSVISGRTWLHVLERSGQI